MGTGLHVRTTLVPVLNKALKISGAVGVGEVRRDGLMCVMLLPGFSAINDAYYA